MSTALLLTRLFVNKDDKRKVLKKQTIAVRTSEIASVRASNRLGFPEHRATITLASGVTYEIAEESTPVHKEVFGAMHIKDMRV